MASIGFSKSKSVGNRKRYWTAGQAGGASTNLPILRSGGLSGHAIRFGGEERIALFVRLALAVAPTANPEISGGVASLPVGTLGAISGALSCYLMYAAYQWKSSDTEIFSDFLQAGKAEEAENQRKVLNVLETFVTPHGSIDAEKMMDEWFPNIEADVFVSHSRANKDLALGFAGFLRESGLTPFVDSCVWQHAHRLLWEIDRNCCKTGDNLISYNGSLITASHVHMMLASALTKMMDRCECVVFISTEDSLQSLSADEMVKGGETVTHSPWLFHEISMMQMLRKRPWEEHRGSLTNFSEGKGKSASAAIPKFDYPVDLSGVPSLADSEIEEWQRKIGGTTKLVAEIRRSLEHPLDSLYEIVPPHRHLTKEAGTIR